MPRVEVDGAQINVETAGAGPPLVLLHGFTGSAASWGPHVVEFARRFFTVSVDLLGHGLSDSPGDPACYGIAHCVEDVLGVMDSLSIAKASILGYSMGGRIALALAIAAPDRVAALIVESTSPGLRSGEARRARAAQDAELADAILRGGVEAFVDRWGEHPLFASQASLPEAGRAALRDQRLRSNPVGLANSLRGVGQGAQPPLHEFLPGLRMPVLVLAGALDQQYCEIAREMSRLIPGARLEIVPGAGHAVHLEQPEAFRRHVIEFIDGVRS
jgi:2-succinyl-6-hydroxy-2,4-cyclohexadiene-1-carboxylate synthase